MQTMTRLARGAVGVVFVLATTMAWAQDAPPVRVRGEITKVEGTTLAVKSRGGEDLTVKFAEPAPFTPAPAGCDHVTFSGSTAKGTADRLSAPAIEGVTTVGAKNHLEITLSGKSDVTDVVIYYAQLSDQIAESPDLHSST